MAIYHSKFGQDNIQKTDKQKPVGNSSNLWSVIGGSSTVRVK